MTIIDGVTDEIYVEMPNGTNLSALTATFTVSSEATANPVSPLTTDFTDSFNNPIEIIVTAEDDTTTKTWSVTVEELAL